MFFFTALWDRITAFLRRLFGRQVEEKDLTGIDLVKKEKPSRKWWQFPF